MFPTFSKNLPRDYTAALTIIPEPSKSNEEERSQATGW